MLGQILIGIIIFLFVVGSGSILMSIWTEHDSPPFYSASIYTHIPVVNDARKYISDNSDIQKKQEPKPISDILESFDMDDLEIEIDEDLIE